MHLDDRLKTVVNLQIVGSRLQWVVIVATCIALGACAHKPAPAQPQYPAVPEQSVRLLAAAPKGSYARRGVVTIEDRLAAMSGDAWLQVRTMAAQTGANGVFVRHQRTFWLRDPQTKQRVRMERTVYELVYMP
jgi:hypothetical protein